MKAASCGGSVSLAIWDGDSRAVTSADLDTRNSGIGSAIGEMKGRFGGVKTLAARTGSIYDLHV
jgi:hypothetical protein